MTLAELQAWLEQAPADIRPDLRARLAAALAGDSGARQAIQDLRVRETLVVQKFDKSAVTTDGVHGLTPVETVTAEFEDGRLIRTKFAPGGMIPCH
jgi:hypothetical protein